MKNDTRVNYSISQNSLINHNPSFQLDHWWVSTSCVSLEIIVIYHWLVASAISYPLILRILLRNADNTDNQKIHLFDFNMICMISKEISTFEIEVIYEFPHRFRLVHTYDANASASDVHKSNANQAEWDGGNLVPRIRVTVDQQSGNEDSGNEIKDGGGGGHLGLNVSRRTYMERLFFILRLRLHLRCPGSHLGNANASANVSPGKRKLFHFLRWRLSLRFYLRCGS